MGQPRARLVRASLLALTFVIGLACPSFAHAQTLTILHSSEHHGQVLPIERRGEKRIAGMAGRAALIASIKKEAEAVLLVDSGDILIGTPLSSFFRGEPDVKAMNLMGYQALAAGNHEFDFGLDHFRRLKELAQFPILCSNLHAQKVELPCRTSAIVKAGPFTIGLVSLLGHRNFPDTFNREVTKLLEFRPPVETARRLARSLKETQAVDLVVAVTHQETDEDLALLAQAPEVDVIVGGHTEGFDGLLTAGSTTPVAELERPGSIFVKTHRLGRTLGRLVLELARRPDGPGMTVVRARAQNLPVNEDVPPDPAVNELVQDYARKLESRTAMTVGRSLVALDGDNNRVRSQETNLGNLLADLLRAEFGTEIALLNGGQIRDSIPVGPVDVKRVLRVLPFDSPTVTITVTGEQLRLALENSVSRLPGTMAGRFLQISGLSVRYDLSAQPGLRVREVSVGGRPLEATRRYSVATDAFLADGGDGYEMFARAQDRIERQVPMRDLLLAALQAKPLKASVEGRIRFVEQPGPAEPHEHPPQTPHPMPDR
ncbi:MAG: bifunctional UDP-sugar hydrolase/5'-nucleotidase [Nitrospirota bacterium]